MSASRIFRMTMLMATAQILLAQRGRNIIDFRQPGELVSVISNEIGIPKSKPNRGEIPFGGVSTDPDRAPVYVIKGTIWGLPIGQLREINPSSWIEGASPVENQFGDTLEWGAYLHDSTYLNDRDKWPVYVAGGWLGAVGVSSDSSKFEFRVKNWSAHKTRYFRVRIVYQRLSSGSPPVYGQEQMPAPNLRVSVGIEANPL